MNNLEIERKFLLTEFPAEKVSETQRIEQGYLAAGAGPPSFPAVSLRLRRKDGSTTFLTIKVGSGVARTEVELALTPGQFEALWPLTEGHRLNKTRHRLPLSPGTFAEVDIYEGSLRGLSTVEVEFSSESEAETFRPPAWFGKEVTADPRYRNWALALSGAPPT